MHAHRPEVIFTLAHSLAEALRVLARQGETINALLGALESAGVIQEEGFNFESPDALLLDENLLMCMGQLESYANQIHVRTRSLRRMRSAQLGDEQRDVSRETSDQGKTYASRRGIIQRRARRAEE